MDGMGGIEGLAGLFAGMGGGMGMPPPPGAGRSGGEGRGAGAGAGGGPPDLGEIMKELGGQDEVKGHAERLWKFMDELAESDPAAYAKFLEDQMKGAGIDPTKGPAGPPGGAGGPTGTFVVETSVTPAGSVGAARSAVVEISRSAGGMAPPQLPSGEPLPSPEALVAMPSDRLAYVQVAFHPHGDISAHGKERDGRRGKEVAYHLECHRCGVDAALRREEVLALLVERAMNQLEREFHVRFDRQKTRVMTARADAPEGMVKAAEQRQKAEAARSAAESLGGGAAAALSPGLLGDLATMAGGPTGGPMQGPARAPKAAEPVVGPAKPLIQMMDDGEGDGEGEGGVEYTLEQQCGADGEPSGVTLVFELPMVARAAEADLEVTAMEVSLAAGGGGVQGVAERRTTVRLPFPVDEDRAKAKFDKASKRLTVRIPALGS